jgi:hypothetical protein
MGENETLKDFLHKIFNHFVCIFNKFQVLPNVKPYEKPIEKIICIDWGHQISKCHSISENIKRDLASKTQYKAI